MIPKAEQECKDCAALKGEIKVLQDKTSQEIKALNSQIGTITKELNARDVDLSNVKKENLVLKSSLTSLDSSTKKEIEMLNATAKLLEKEVELARENNLVLKETNLSLRVEIDRILGEQQECSIPRKIFECERTGDYIIYLTKGYSLYIDETEAE